MSKLPEPKLVDSTTDLQVSIAHAIKSAQSSDPFAPVTVLVNSTSQGWALRRQVIASMPSGTGIANINVITVHEFMSLCSGQIGKPISRGDKIVRALAADQLLAEESGLLKATQGHAPSALRLQSIADDLVWCSTAKLSTVQLNISDTSHATLNFINKMRSTLTGPSAVIDWVNVADEFVTNEDIEPFAHSLGRLIITVQRIPDALERILVHLISYGTTLDMIKYSRSPNQFSAHVIDSPDPGTEAAIAVRNVAAVIASGVPAHDIAVVCPSSGPLSGFMGVEFDRAGIAWHGASNRWMLTLAKAQLALLLGEMAHDRASGRISLTRRRLMTWVSSGIVQSEGDARPYEMKKLIREHGLFGDTEKWLPILDAMSKQDSDSDQDESPSDISRVALSLSSVIKELRDVVTVISSSTSWTDIGQSVLHGLTFAHGPLSTKASSSESKAVAGLLSELLQSVMPRIDSVSAGGAVPALSLPSLLERYLGSIRLRQGSSVSGVLVADLSEVECLKFSHVFVVGAREGDLPAAGTADMLLPDTLRNAIRVKADDLLTSTERVEAQRNVLMALLASANSVTVSYSRAGVPGSDEGHLSPWFMPLDEPIKVRSSFDALGRWNPTHTSDIEARENMSGKQLSHEISELLDSANAWVRFHVDPPFGNVDMPLSLDGKTLSSSGIESFLHCPHQFFVTRFLGFQTDKFVDDVDVIARNDLGTMIHKVLETFYKDATEAGLVPTLGDTWSPEARAALIQCWKDAAADAESKQIVGWLPTWWRESSDIELALPRLLRLDAAYRRDAKPIGFEVPFGIEGAPEVPFATSSGAQVALRGYIDRVDENNTSGRFLIVDYKSGKPDTFKKSFKQPDPASREKIQDLVYGVAAKVLYPRAQSIDVSFIFFPNRGNPEDVPSPGGDFELDLRTVLDSMESQLASGRFPTHPVSNDFCLICNALGRRARMDDVSIDDEQDVADVIEEVVEDE